MKSDIKLERTGNVFSFASTEYRVTYPDGFVGTIWSPPWHEWDDDEEDARAMEYATAQWEARTHKDKKS